MFDVITSLLETLSNTFLALGPIGVVLIVTMEYACIPLASEILLPFLGFMVSQGKLSFMEIFLASVLGGLLGSLAVYTVGYYGGQAVLNWIKRRSPKIDRGVSKALQWFEKYNRQSVMAARILPAIRTWISLPAGLGKMPLPTFIGFSLIGIVSWNAALMTLGYVLGDQWTMVGTVVSKYSYVILLALVLVGLAYWFIRKSGKGKATKDTQGM